MKKINLKYYLTIAFDVGKENLNYYYEVPGKVKNKERTVIDCFEGEINNTCRAIGGSVGVDATINASLYGVFAFGAYRADDEKVRSTMRQIHERLWCKTKIGGLARYENDYYKDLS